MSVMDMDVKDLYVFFFQAEDGIRDYKVTGVQTCALPICRAEASSHSFGLAVRIPLGASKRNAPLVEAAMTALNVAEAAERQFKDRQQAALTTARLTEANAQQIGRASCRERV